MSAVREYVPFLQTHKLMDHARYAKWAVPGIIVLLLLFYVWAIFSFRGDAVRLEEKIKAQYSQNQNNYDSMWKTFNEMAQVPQEYTAELRKIYDEVMAGRYGEKGSQAIFQWIQEHNPNIDPAVYMKVQTAIEARRVSFAADQQQLIDQKREYGTLLRSNRALCVNWSLGFPKIDLDQYGIVTSDATQKAFEEKKADEVKIFK